MNAALLLVATLLAGQVESPPAKAPARPAADQKKPASDKPAIEKPTGEKPAADEEEEKQPIFTLDQIAAGAKNDAFVDEFLRDKTLKLYGRVMQIERLTTGDKADEGYRVLMGRLSREDRGVDVEVWFMFPTAARKELSMLEPGESKITIEGTCAETQLQSLTNGLGFTLAIKDCKLVETPEDIEGPLPTAQRTSILPIITPNAPPATAPPAVPPIPPAPALPPLPPGRAAP
jgi:hypothetical protein